MQPFASPTIVIMDSPLTRRVIRFYLLGPTLVLDYDADEERATTRHKFRPVRWWSRLDSRNNTMARREPPEEVIADALADVRAQIRYERPVPLTRSRVS